MGFFDSLRRAAEGISNGSTKGQIVPGSCYIYVAKGSGNSHPAWMDQAIDYLNNSMLKSTPTKAKQAILELRPFFIYPVKMPAIRQLGYSDPLNYVKVLRDKFPKVDLDKYLYEPAKLLAKMNRYKFKDLDEYAKAMRTVWGKSKSSLN